MIYSGGARPRNALQVFISFATHWELHIGARFGSEIEQTAQPRKAKQHGEWNELEGGLASPMAV